MCIIGHCLATKCDLTFLLYMGATNSWGPTTISDSAGLVLFLQLIDLFLEDPLVSTSLLKTSADVQSHWTPPLYFVFSYSWQWLRIPTEGKACTLPQPTMDFRIGCPAPSALSSPLILRGADGCLYWNEKLGNHSGLWLLSVSWPDSYSLSC